MKKSRTLFCLALAAVMLLSGVISVSAVTRQKAREIREDEKKGKNSLSRMETFERQGTAIDFHLLLGKVVGEAAGEIDHYNGELNNKITAGFGGELETPLSDNIYMGGSLEWEWNWPHKDVGAVRFLTAAVRTRWQFTPLKRNTFFATTGIGMGWASYQGDLNIDDDLGSHFSLYFGLGRQVRFGSSSINGFEFYYRMIFSKDSKLERSAYDTVPINVSTVGLRAIVGIQL